MVGAMYWSMPTVERGSRLAALAKARRGPAVSSPDPATSRGYSMIKGEDTPFSLKWRSAVATRMSRQAHAARAGHGRRERRSRRWQSIEPTAQSGTTTVAAT